MKKKLMNNWSLKLLSLAFAFFIWLSVVSYSNPISTYTISGIPVEFEHEELITERGLSVEVVGKQTATIAVTVNRETSARISADDFKAVAPNDPGTGVTFDWAKLEPHLIAETVTS